MTTLGEWEREAQQFNEYSGEDRVIYLKDGKVARGVLHVGGTIIVLDHASTEFRTVFKEDIQEIV